MAMRRILVTGAEGFVGRHLQVALRAAYPEAELAMPGFDVTDGAAVVAGVAAARPDAVVHLAAIAAPMDAKRNPELAWRVNLMGTLSLARAVLQTAPEAVLLFAGTADAYGASFRPGTPVDETAALAPQNAYGATKAAMEHLVLTWAHEMETLGVSVSLFDPGPVRTRLRADAFPGEHPMTLPAPAEVAPRIAALCMRRVVAA